MTSLKMLFYIQMCKTLSQPAVVVVVVAIMQSDTKIQMC